jgi:hypothetical protein
VQASTAPATAVTTLDHKPMHLPGDAWATALATGVEQKIAGLKESDAAAAPAEPAEQPEEEVHTKSPNSTEALLESAATESLSTAPAGLGNWAAVPETSWEAEAKRASMLASTWDAPPTPSTEETPEVSAYASEEHPTTHAEAPVETPAYSPYATTDHEIAVSPMTEASEAVAEEAAPTLPAAQLESHWQAPMAEPAAEVTAAQSEFVAEAPAVVPAPAEPESSEQNMDELVARVVAKMNPEVLQKVTQEILKPVIEALIREELNSKKS